MVVMSLFNATISAFGLAGLMTLAAPLAHSAGMVPETSVVIIDAGQGEGTINVTNTDPEAALLYTTLERLEGDEEELLVVNPTITRVEAGQSQRVRFIFQSDQPLTVQRLQRVNFESIAQRRADGTTGVALQIAQNLPVLINPADLPRKKDPWSLLQWSLAGEQVRVSNMSRYVVRLHQQVLLNPGEVSLSLPRTYLLPGQTELLPLPAGWRPAPQTQVKIYPASVYGYQVGEYETVLVQ
jgi:P pilus assembly chaperone PapD